MKPKYTDVYEKLLTRLSAMEPGDQLASETQLSKDFHVSPMTVRRALMLLQQEGRTIGIPGKGTFVSHRSGRVAGEGFAPAISANGVVPEARLFSASMELADDDAAQQFSLGAGSFIVTIERLHYGDGEPIGIEIVRVNPDVFPEALRMDLTCDGSILDHIAKTVPDGKWTKEYSIRAALATNEEAEMLGVEDSCACLHVVVNMMDSHSVCVGRSHCVYMGNKYEVEF